jgi:hypothetical protein
VGLFFFCVDLAGVGLVTVPFKSDSQRRKFYAMAERGEISKAKVAEYEKETKGDLPERVPGAKSEAKKKAKMYGRRKASEKNA